MIVHRALPTPWPAVCLGARCWREPRPDRTPTNVGMNLANSPRGAFQSPTHRIERVRNLGKMTVRGHVTPRRVPCRSSIGGFQPDLCLSSPRGVIELLYDADRAARFGLRVLPTHDAANTSSLDLARDMWSLHPRGYFSSARSEAVAPPPFRTKVNPIDLSKIRRQPRTSGLAKRAWGIFRRQASHKEARLRATSTDPTGCCAISGRRDRTPRLSYGAARIGPRKNRT